MSFTKLNLDIHRRIPIPKMPDTSDSEAFESADEDFVEPSPHHKKDVSRKSVVDDEQSKQDADLRPSAKDLEKSDCKKPQESKSEDVEDDGVQLESLPSKDQSDRNVVEPPPRNLDSLKKSDGDDIEISSPSVQPNKSAVLSEDHSGIETIKADIPKSEEKIVESLPIVESKRNEDDDGWEFDDWGDDEPAPNKKMESAPDAKTTEDDDVGWEVEDWGDEPQPIEPIKPIANTEAKSTNILGNLSELLISGDDAKPVSAPIANPLDRLSDAGGDSASNWGWKPWGGVANLLSTATDGVASITSHVSSVIESGIGVPNPEEMARIQREDRQKRQSELTTDNPHSADESSGQETSRPNRGDDASLLLGQFVSGMTHIGNRVLSGGLDTLEGIGKKTMTILKENDKGLLDKQRKMLMEGQGPALSQVTIDY